LSDRIETVDPAVAALHRSLEEVAALADERGFGELAGEARRAAEPLEAGEIRIVVLGQFKRGKSSVLNALLGREILPTGVVPLTTVPTFLRTGRPARTIIRYSDGREEEVSPEELDAYVTERGNPGNEKKVERVEITCPARHLVDGIVLVDTPGIGSAERDATERAFGFLPRVDAGLVVLSADPPIGEMELELVRRTAELTPHLFFVFNKVDLHPEESWREALDYCRRRLAEALGRDPRELAFFPLSARQALETGAEQREGSRARKGLEALGRMLRELGQERGEEIARDVASRRLGRLAAEGLGLLDLEEAALRTPLAELEERMAALRGRARELDHYLDEVPALCRSAAERAVEAAGRSLYRRAGSLAPALAAEIRSRAGEARLSNRALADDVRRMAGGFVAREFDAWQQEEGRQLSGTFRADLARLAGRLDEELVGVRTWVAEQFGIELPHLVPARELTESRDFYYRVEGVSQHRMLDAPRFWLPRPLFRRWLARRADRLAREDVDRNAGRLRGDLQYRYQDTARAFASDLREHARAARASLEGALERALDSRRTGEEETRAEIERLDAARLRLRELQASAGSDQAGSGTS
jgi:GTP-binding protein EngB required for normal cell division